MSTHISDPTRPWAGSDPLLPFSVTEWGSDPTKEENDDCWTGEDFTTLQEAETELRRLLEGGAGRSTAFVLLDGPGIQQTHPVPSYHTPQARKEREHQREREAREDRQERATQAGMAFGCDDGSYIFFVVRELESDYAVEAIYRKVVKP